MASPAIIPVRAKCTLFEALVQLQHSPISNLKRHKHKGLCDDNRLLMYAALDQKYPSYSAHGVGKVKTSREH